MGFISSEEMNLDYKSRACCGYIQIFNAFFLLFYSIMKLS